MIQADMHTHSYFSDGSYSPTQIVQIAKKLGLKAICLTDHDAFSGLPEFISACQKNGLDFLCGIEITAYFEGIKTEILAYGINLSSITQTQNKLKGHWQAHDSKIQAMLDKYEEKGIFKATLDDIKKVTGHKGPFATKGWLREFRIKKFNVKREKAKEETRKNGLAYAPYDKSLFMNPAQALAVIQKLRWKPVLAHGGVLAKDLKNFEQWKNLIESFVQKFKPLGLFGIEAYHHRNEIKHTEFLIQIANKYGLIITGGSDFHGEFQPQKIGQYGVSYEEFLEIKQKIEENS